MRRDVLLCSTILILIGVAAAQEQKKSVPMTASGRLAAARTAYVKNAGGTSIAFKVIDSAIGDSGRFTMVDVPEKADIVIEVSAPEEGGGVSVSSSTSRSPVTGSATQSTSTTRKISSGPVKMVVLDGKSKAVLWTGSEQPKFAVKQKAREDNLVEAAQRLVARFRERLEAAPAQ